MSDDELNKLSHEDLVLFEERLTAFFHMSVDESFVQLRKHLERSFLRSRVSDISYLVDKSLTRLMRKVAEFEKRGEQIEDLKAFASKIAMLVYLEHHRMKSVEVNLELRSDSDSPSPPIEHKYIPDVEITAIEKQLAWDCMTHCLKGISKERFELLFDYYRGDAEEKKRRRRKLALGTTIGLEPSEQQVRNLRTRVCKIKTKLSECLDHCFETKRSRDRKLHYLRAQQIGT